MASRIRALLGLPQTTEQRIEPANVQQRGITMDIAQSELPIGGLWSRGLLTLKPSEQVSAALERCVSLIASNQASLDLQVRNFDTGDVDEKHPVALLWNRDSNPYMSARMTREVVFRRQQRFGQCFVCIDRGPTAMGVPAQLFPIFGDVTVVVDDLSNEITPRVIGYQVGRKRIPLLPSEVLWFRFPNGQTQFDYASPEAIASYPVKVDSYAREWQLGEYRNSARPSGILRLGDVETETQESIKNQMRSTVMGGSNAGKIIALSGDEAAGSGFERISLTPAEMSYIESRKVNADEIALGMGVPRDLLFGESTYDNQRSAKVALWTETIVPQLDLDASEIDRQLIDDPSETCLFDTSKVEALREQLTDQYNRVQRVTISDITTLDESRQMIGLEPLPNGLGSQTLTPYRAQFGIAPPPPALKATGASEGSTSGGTGGAAKDITPQTRAAGQKVSVPADMIARHHRMASSRMMAFLERQGNAVHDHYVSGGDIAQALDAKTWRPQLHTLAKATLTSAALDAGNAIATQVHAAGRATPPPYNPTQSVNDYIAARSDFTADSMDETTADEVGKLTDQMQSDGADKAAIAAAILAYFAATGRAGDRADMFAVAEVYPMINLSARQSASDSGAALSRQWATAGDDSVDGECEGLEGQVTGLDEPYPSGDEPGGVHFGCRCTEDYVFTESVSEQLAQQDSTDTAALEVRADMLEGSLLHLTDKLERIGTRNAKKGRPLVDVNYWRGQVDDIVWAQGVEALTADAMTGGLVDRWIAEAEKLTGDRPDFEPMRRLAHNLARWAYGLADEDSTQ